MTDAPCDEMHFLLQADVDGELTPAEAARVAVHLERCEGCAAMQATLLALSTRLRTEAPRHVAPVSLRASVRERLAPGSRAERLFPRFWPSVAAPAFGRGFALASCLALVAGLALFDLKPVGPPLAEVVVAAHIRALQPGHLRDVVSTDQHTVKPWFDGRLAFAPPVKNLEAVGFPLTGGRLDYLAGRAAAALVYRHGAHEINLFVWPDRETGDRSPARGTLDGYHYETWAQDGMAFWAVTDLNAKDLSDFIERWRAS